MAISATAHLNFYGNAREALTFYQTVFGGQLFIATYGETGVPRDLPDSDRADFAPLDEGAPDADKVSFGLLVGSDGFRLAGYDVYGRADGGSVISAVTPPEQARAAGLGHAEPFFLLLNGDSREEITPSWEKLAEGGRVIQALAPSMMAPAYGMLTDRFGVTWVFGVTPA